MPKLPKLTKGYSVLDAMSFITARPIDRRANRALNDTLWNQVDIDESVEAVKVEITLNGGQFTLYRKLQKLPLYSPTTNLLYLRDGKVLIVYRDFNYKVIDFVKGTIETSTEEELLSLDVRFSMPIDKGFDISLKYGIYDEVANSS